MKTASIAFALCLTALSPAYAQTAAGSSAGSTSAGGAAGTTLSNGSTSNGMGGSPGRNASNALNHGTTGNNLGTVQNNSAPGAAVETHGNAVDTPAAQSATQSLGNTDTGILKSRSPAETENVPATASHSASQRARGLAKVGVSGLFAVLR